MNMFRCKCSKQQFNCFESTIRRALNIWNSAVFYVWFKYIDFRRLLEFKRSYCVFLCLKFDSILHNQNWKTIFKKTSDSNQCICWQNEIKKQIISKTEFCFTSFVGNRLAFVVEWKQCRAKRRSIAKYYNNSRNNNQMTEELWTLLKTHCATYPEKTLVCANKMRLISVCEWN